MNTKTEATLRSAGVDLEGALHRFGGNSAMYEKFLYKFLSDESFSKIGPAINREDWETAVVAAHTLKGVSANLGINHLYKACTETVDLLREGNNAEAKESYKELSAAYEEIYGILILATGEN